MRAPLLLVVLVAACRSAPPLPVTPPGDHDAAPSASATDTRAEVETPDAGAAPLYTARTLPVVPTDGGLRLAKSPDYPAVNREGTVIVVLDHDMVDFAGTAIEHVVFLDAHTGRRSADLRIFDEMDEREGDATKRAASRRRYTANVAEASRRLAATTWRTLEGPSAEGETGPWASLHASRADAGETLAVRIGDDLDVELPGSTGSETVAPLTIRSLRGTALVPTTARIRIPRLATQGGMTGRSGRAPCGSVQRVEGWADPERRFVLLALEPMVPGDACTVQLASDTMVLVPLPR